jgi:AcrR family transcriptional regulator
MLRERRLHPGPGKPAADVARNQRSRLFGAMVASVAERGYAATRLSDLVELSGVSRKSFYSLFADKEECFVGAIEAMLEDVLAAAQSFTGGWEEQVRGATAAFAEVIVAQPAAARMCLFEAYAVGPTGVAPIERATARYEAQALAAARAAGLRGEDLESMISAQVGALMEIARERLRLQREADLPGLMEDFANLVLSSRPPPEPLRLTTRRPPSAPETVDAHGHVERVLRAFAFVAAEHGYANTTIELVLKRAGMSPTTFYASFESKEDVLYAAIESAGAQLIAAIMPSFRRNPIWEQGVRAAYGDFFNFLASRPALAQLLLVEVYAAGPTALERREEALRPLEVLLAEGRARRLEVGALALEAIFGAIYRLAYKQIRVAGAESLGGLAPLCTYITLSPLIGADEACVVASGDGRGRGPGVAEHDRMLLSRVGLMLTKCSAPEETIARELGVPVERVHEQIDHLVEAGLIVAVEEADGEETQTVYHTATDYIEDEVWDRMSYAERRHISIQVANLVLAEIDRAIETGTFDARLDRHFTRIPLQLDERGWRQVFELHFEAFHATIRIQAEAAERLAREGKAPILGSSVQALFEVPKL